MIAEHCRMDLRRLHLLSELDRLGSMRAVADELGLTTSTVSQQIAVLSREAGVALIEPDGRRIRLTPAGHRLAAHAVTILAAVDAARLDLDPDAEPSGMVRVAGFATAIRRSLLPMTADLARHHPRVSLRIHEHEPAEALGLMAADQVDLALTYDFNLAPAPFDHACASIPLWTTGWGLGVPAADAEELTEPTRPAGARQREATTAEAVFDHFRAYTWIVNSRNEGDEQVIRTIASMANFEPRIMHRADSLELVQDLIVAGLGIGLVPVDQPVIPGVGIVALTSPSVLLRAYAVTRAGRAAWAPVSLVTRLLTS